MYKYTVEEHEKSLDVTFEAFAKEVMSAQTAETLTVLYATDVHYIRSYPHYVPVYKKLQEMVQFSKHIGADLLALTGDTVDGNGPLEEMQYRDLFDVLTLLKEADVTSMLISKGNHDNAQWFAYRNKLGAEAAISAEQWYNHVINPIRTSFPITLDPENVTGGYYYVDYPLQKIRVINLNTSDLPIVLDDQKRISRKYCTQWEFGLSEKQLRWLTKALTFAEPDWSVVLCSHYCPLTKQDNCYNGELLEEIINAYREGRKGCAVSDEPVMGATVGYDFTENSSNDLLVWLAGHVHLDRVWRIEGITVVESLNLLGFNHGQEPYLVEIPGVGTVGKDLYNGWDCMLIDKKRRLLTAKRYGRRELDRTIEL